MRYQGLTLRDLIKYFEVAFRDDFYKEIERVKTLVALARAVFVI
jgi:hypothetical protein